MTNFIGSDLSTYVTLALSYAGLGAVFGSLLPSLKHGIEHGSGRVSDIPQAAVPVLVPADHLPGLIGNSDRYAATSAHVTPRSLHGPQSGRGEFQGVSEVLAAQENGNR